MGEEGSLAQVVRPERGADRFQNAGVTMLATPVGMQVRVTARVVAFGGRRVAFEVAAFDDVELVARGTYERVVIDLERFLARVEPKRASGLKRGPDVH